MKRVKGTAGVSLFECINADLNKWNVRWDVQENPETDEGQTNGINYMEETFLFKPDLSDVQQIISFWCGSTEATAKFVLDGKTIEMSEQGLLFLRSQAQASEGDNVSIVTSEGVIEVTSQEAQYIVNDMTRYLSAYNNNTLTLLNEIDAADSIDVLTVMDYSTGYPTPTSMTLQQVKDAVSKQGSSPEQQAVLFARMTINSVDLSNNDALAVKDLHPSWESFIGKELKAKSRVTYGGSLFRVRQDINPVLENQPPSVETAALYEEINEENAGTIDDPIPYNNNMELFAGKYYSQNGVVYKCTRNTEQAVYQDLADLVGIYVEKIE